jgi:Sporulation and spore germination
MRRGRVLRGSAAIATLLVLAACGVSTQKSPRQIGDGDIPFGLADRAPAGAATSTGAATFQYDIYLVSGDRLEPVKRGQSAVVSATAVLRALTKGPTTSEAAAGLRTLLDPGTTVDHVAVRGDLATIDLNGDPETFRPGADQSLALAQLVYTATALPGVSRVQVRLGGSPAEIPRGDGTLTTGPVRRSDYPAAG